MYGTENLLSNLNFRDFKELIGGEYVDMHKTIFDENLTKLNAR